MLEQRKTPDSFQADLVRDLRCRAHQSEASLGDHRR